MAPALIAFALVGFSLVAGRMPEAQEGGGDGTTPIVVELFTSQGCSSCPPAEAYLGDLAVRPDVIALEFHVDYWDHIGWRDPFAKPAYTDRQRRYGARLDQRYIYTPQMVVDGAVHVIGSRRPSVEAQIDAARTRRHAARSAATAPLIALASNPDGGLRITLSGPAPDGVVHDLVLVGFDDRHETVIRSGENAGKTLVNRHVVRRLDTLERWAGGSRVIEVPAERLEGDGGCAVLLQRADQGRIAAARMIRF